MDFILYILYFYLIVYTIYLFVLSLRNLNDRPFSIEKKYSKYDEYKRNFAVIIYSHNMLVKHLFLNIFIKCVYTL